MKNSLHKTFSNKIYTRNTFNLKPNSFRNNHKSKTISNKEIKRLRTLWKNSGYLTKISTIIMLSPLLLFAPKKTIELFKTIIK